MKICVSLAISVLAAVVLLGFLPVHGEAEIYDSVIRLHVLAASDDTADQALKLEVRDRVLAELEPLLADTAVYDEAAAILAESTDRLENSVERFLTDTGRQESVQVRLVREKYPTREYDAFTLPAGEYLSLQVVLGEGEGQNWWCVLFPSVCSRFAVRSTARSYAEAGFTPAQYRLITHTEEPRYQVRFRVLEILESLLPLRR